MKSLLFFLFVILLYIQPNDASCDVIPVSTWGGTPLNRHEVLPGPVNIVVIQHTVTPECRSDEECVAVVNGIRRHHTQNLGFDDIGQSFLIGGNGKVYEGAGWQLVGAHTKSFNRRAIGISFIGEFSGKLPSPLALKALRSLLDCGVVNKFLTEGYHMVGHSQLSPTQSPGAMLQKHIELWPHWLDHAKEMLN